MKTFSSFRFPALIFFIALFLSVFHSSARACAACWGDTTGSKMSNAADVGVIAMAIIMFVMLGAVGAFIRHLAYRAKHPLPDYDELLRKDEKPRRPEAT